MANWWDSAPLAEPDQSPAQGGGNWWDAAPLADGEPTTYDTYVAPVVKAASDAANYVGTAIQGKHDPKFKGLPNIRDASGLIMDGAADSTAISDDAYADVYAKSLGERYIGTIRDANGYPIIKFRGDDGKEQMAYVNRPGLDWHDVERGVSAALPYMAAAGGVGRLAAGAGSAANIGLQGLTAAGVSVGQDVAAQGLGSRQPVDATRAVMSGVLGAGGELVGRAIVPFIRKIRKNKALVGDDGKLTAKGRKLAQDEGLDPKLVDEDMAQRLQKASGQAADPAEALRKVQTDRFGIPTTKAQRTNDPQMLLIEKDIRAGTLGDRAKESLRGLEDTQKAAIERAARGDSGGGTGTNVIAPRLAPKRAVNDQGFDSLGTGTKQGLEAAKKRIKDLENQAWKGTENISPRAGATDNIGDYLARSVGTLRVKKDLTPSSSQMLDEIRAFKSGKVTDNANSDLLGQQSVTYVDEMRRVLMGLKNGAAPGTTDQAAAKAIYKGFDDWMVAAAEKNLLTGSPGAAQKILQARRTTAELRSVLKPMKDGKKTSVARILEKVGNAETGEETLKALLGSSGPKGDLPSGAVQAIRHFKAATTKLGGETGKNAWNDVRLAYWLKLVGGKNGDMLPNGTLITSITTSFKNRPSLMNALYSPDEQKLMKQFAQAIKSATPKDPNPPGSGTAVRGLFPNLVKDQLQAASTRATFGSKGKRHKILLARIYRGLSKVLPQVLDGKNQFGSMAASRATSQNLTPKALPSAGGYGAAFGPSQTTDRTSQFSPNRMLRR